MLIFYEDHFMKIMQDYKLKNVVKIIVIFTVRCCVQLYSHITEVLFQVSIQSFGKESGDLVESCSILLHLSYRGVFKNHPVHHLIHSLTYGHFVWCRVQEPYMIFSHHLYFIFAQFFYLMYRWKLL